MSTPQDVDLLIRNGCVISMDDGRRIFDSGAIAVADGVIVAVGPDRDVAATVKPVRVIDAEGGPVHPGFVDAHMHVSHQLIRGTFSDTIPWEDVVDAFFLDYWREIDDADEFAGSVLGCLEMIRNGTTCFLEAGSVFEPDTTAEAAKTVGIRALLSDPFIWDQGALSGGTRHLRDTPRDTEEAVTRLGSELRRNDDATALVQGHVAIWGLGTASDELYVEAKRIAAEAGVVLNAHQSFARLDCDGDHERLGTPPVCHYDDLGVIDERTTLAHANFLTDDEVRRLTERRASVAWCPAVSMIWATGATPAGRHAELLRGGCNVALGTDSSIVANPLDLTQAGMLAILTARDGSARRDALFAEDALEMATINGARAAGLEDRIGSLQPGRRADIVIRDAAMLELYPRGDVVDQLVYTGSARGVDTVVVDGKVVLEGGAFPQLDEERLRWHANERVEALLERMGWSIRPRWPLLDRG
jgi:cytosine/adenosine deaminase-related metal-dependent hydrolase